MDTTLRSKYQKRTYRTDFAADDLCYYRVCIKQSDLFIGTTKPLRDVAMVALREARKEVEIAVSAYPAFGTSLVPIPHRVNASPLVKGMCLAAEKVGVGPMAAVAGAIAQAVGRKLLEYSDEVIVENGGDIFIHSSVERKVGVFAGDSPFSGKLAIWLPAGEWGVCTSSGVIGPSLSMGLAQVAMVLSKDAAFSDAAATALGNTIQRHNDLKHGVNYIMTLADSIGALAMLDDKVAIAGQIVLTEP